MKNRDFSSDIIERFYQEDPKAQCRNITFQVTDDCCLKCSYCYQTHKGHAMMTNEVAKAAVDLLFKLYDENDENMVINHHTYGIVLDMIGGEPFMNVDVMDFIVGYFIQQCYERDHIWLTNFRVGISTNGLLYFEPKVQAFLNKYASFISMNVTIDGPKDIHDLCRVDYGGSGSFDRAMAAWNDWFLVKKHNVPDTKVTIAPENLPNIGEIFDFFLSKGCTSIHANPIFEHKWTEEEASLYYKLLIKLADRLLEVEGAESSLFSDFKGEPLSANDTNNWCWGAGTPILTEDGYKPIEEINIGTRVYTHDGTLHPVINVTSHYADNVVQLSTSGAYPLICTKDHKVFAQPFDYKGWKGVKHWKPYGKYTVESLKSNDLIQLFEMPTKNESIDLNIAYLVGRYIGDGWDARDHHSHNICCAFDETMELQKHFEDANIDFSINHNKTVNQFDILHTDNTKELHSILQDCGHLATGKHLPKIIWSWSKTAQEQFLQGYLDADGSYQADKKLYKLNTVSYQLANDLLLLLRTLGYTPNCYHYRRGGKAQILGREVNIHDRYEIYFYLDNRNKFVKRIDDKIWTTNNKIIDVEPQMVYNITVEENHSYVAGGIVSSNCGGTSAMLAFDPQGKAYPCLRYMASSLSPERKPIVIGDTSGIYNTPEYRAIYEDMQKVTRQSQSTQECLDCPVASGCAWCSAENYNEFGTYNKRSTNICWMHRAEALAGVYYWNTYYRMHNMTKRKKMYLPMDIAMHLITANEYNKLLMLSNT